MTRARALGLFSLLLAVATCGGTQSVGEESPGQSNRTGGGQSGESIADDLDVPDSADGENGSAEAGDGTAETDTDTDDASAADGDAPAVTFRLMNTADEDVVFSLDRGWQPVLVAFSGTPPNAKSFLMFPNFGTASCAVDAAVQCPVCAQPER
ncbi:MAG: hypothetical protein AAGC55_13180, partial [Myxococcota bacterium]